MLREVCLGSSFFALVVAVCFNVVVVVEVLLLLLGEESWSKNHGNHTNVSSAAFSQLNTDSRSVILPPPTLAKDPGPTPDLPPAHARSLNKPEPKPEQTSSCFSTTHITFCTSLSHIRTHTTYALLHIPSHIEAPFSYLLVPQKRNLYCSPHCPSPSIPQHKKKNILIVFPSSPRTHLHAKHMLLQLR